MRGPAKKVVREQAAGLVTSGAEVADFRAIRSATMA
jgi:hypothetical protein